MTAVEPDGLDEAAERVLRTALMAAAQLTEHLARAHQQHQQQARAGTERELREIEHRRSVDRAAAHAEFAGVRDPRWWATASPEDITRAYTTAHQWAPTSPAAAAAEQRIRTEVHDRFLLDLPPAATPAAGSEVGGTGAAVRGRIDREPWEAVAAVLTADARAEALTTALRGVTDPDTVTARVLADQFQAHPATDATRPPPAAAGFGPDTSAPVLTRQPGMTLDRD